MQKRRNDVKARTTLLLALPDEHQLKFSKYKTAQELWAAILKTFGRNEATKKTKKNMLKQQYGNFKAEGSETLEQTFNKLQAIVSHLEFMDIEIEQDDLNQKFLTSLAPEWLMHTIVWRNRSDLDTMTKNSSGNKEVNTASIPTASTQVSPVGPNVATASISLDTACAYIASQSNASQIKYKDINQIDEDDIEEIDINWATLLGSAGLPGVKTGEGEATTDKGLRPSPAIENNSNDFQNKKPSVAETEASSSTILSKHAIKFVKSIDRPTETKTDKVETAKKPAVKYAELYRKTSKSSNGNSQINIDDKGYWDSGCSRHMTGNISYLSDYEPFDGGYVLFECIVLGRNFKLTDDTNVLLRTPRQHNMYSVDLNNVVPHKDLTCLVAKASADECMLWHRRLGYLNIKTMNRLVRHNLVRCLPSKYFNNAHTCVACLKEKQHKASCKTKLVNSVSKPLYTLHMDLFGLTSDETRGILRNFITGIENLKDLKVKIIRCDNGSEFRNKEMNDFCSRKGIKREFSNARTPQQNEVAERRNRTLIEAARTMLADAKLPVTFWAEAVNTACYVQNRVLVNKSQNKTPYELFNGRTPAIGFLKRFGCHVMILNTLDHLGKFEVIGDEGINSTSFSGTKEVAGQDVKKDVSSLRYIALPNWFHEAHLESSTSNAQDACNVDDPKSSGNSNPTATSTNLLADHMETLAVETPIPTNVWRLIDCPKGVRPIGTKWVLKNKKDERGIVIRNKARLVAQGHTQEDGIDYDEVFAPVIRIEAIRLFLAYASFIGFTVYQMDVKSTFLYGTIDEEVYVMQPPRFQDPEFPARVYKVEKAMCGLHQAPRAWYGTLSKYLLTNGFQRGIIDQTLFIRRQRGDFILIQVYVDDIIFGSSNLQLCREFKALMHEKFQMSAMGELNFFLGLQVLQKKDVIFLSQDKYVGDILKKFGYSDVRSANTLIDKENPWGKDETGKDVDLHLYISMIGSLMYLTASRPDIMFAVCACARHQVTPKECHLHAVKRIFKYLKGHPKLGLWYPKESPFDLVAYSDSDYGGATQDCKSTTGGCQFLGRRLISWQCKKQTIVSTSTTEAGYVAVANGCGQVPHHIIRDCFEKKLISVDHIHTDDNVADLLTKPFECLYCYIIICSTARIETTDEGTKILAIVDGKPRTNSESSIRRNLKLRDEAGISSLPDVEFFKNLTLLGYNILPNQKFSFQKGQFSHQWKYLIHTIMQCLSPKSTGFNEFSSNIATALVCLATNRVYNFSKMIFDGMVRNVNNKVSKFLMYPRQYTRRARIAQSSALPTVADEPASPFGDDSQGEACLTVSGLESEQDRANITKTSTLPSDSTPRVTSIAADEGSMQHKLQELTNLCTHLQRQQTEMASKITAQDLEIATLKARIKHLEDKDGGDDDPSGEDATIKGRRLETGDEATIERSAEKGSDDTEEMVNVLTSLDAASVLSSGVQVSVPPSVEVATVSIPPAGEVSTGSDVVPTASPIFTTATVVTPYTRRKEEEMERDAQRMNEQITRDAKITRIHAEEELQIMIDGLDRNNETVAKYLQEYHQFAAELPIGRRIELISDLVKYQDNYAKVLKHFNRMTLKEIKDKFDPVWKQIEDFIPIGSKEEGERFKRKGLRLEQDSAKKHFDKEDLNQLWALVKETLNIRQATSNKEKELWVELKILYEPDVEDQLLAMSSDNAQSAITYTSISSDSDGPSWEPLGHKAAMIHIRDDILEEDMPSRRRFAFIAPLPGCDVAESSAAAARAPRSQNDFVDTVEAGQALQAFERRMMTSIEEVNLRVSYQVQVRRQESKYFYTQLHDAQTDRIDIRLKTDLVRGQRTGYETKLDEVHQAYLSSEARNRALLARIETLKTHMSRMEWQRQSAKDLAVTQMMCIHILEARARTDTVEDAGSSCYRIMLVTRQGTNDTMTLESVQAMIDQAIQRNSTHTQDDASQSSGGGLKRPVQPTRVCSYIDFMKCQPLNFKGTEGVVGLSQWLKKMESVFYINDCAVDNQRTLKKKMTDKYCPKGEIKKLEIELWNLKVKGNNFAAYTQRFQELALMCTKFLADETKKVDKYISGLPDKIHGNFMSARPKTLDETIELANDLMDQKLRTYAERRNDNKRKADDSLRNNHQQQPHKKQNVARAYTASPDEKKNRGNGNGNDVAQGRAYALGGRDASPNSNVIT
nr:putative ribonuclease H-like domain-containing protein [Tanacetum cinerariifolium]